MIMMVEKFLATIFLLTIAALLSILTFHINVCQEVESSTSDHVIYEINHQKNTAFEGFPNDPNPLMDSPKVAWLMSFPNSGTSFTMELVGQASNRSTATNYGLECDFDRNGENVPLYVNSPNGPYVAHPDKGLPDHYILTKTHCGGRCADCGPKSYLETKESFVDMCGKGAHVSISNMAKVHVKYDPTLAQRAIHLVRNPFNNIVSNFHLERHTKAKKGKGDWLKRYPNNSSGFRKWCSDIDQKYAKEEASVRLIPDSIIHMFDGLPCHKAFYAFAQWHNLAIRVIQDLRLPDLVIHYEDYETQFNSTANRIFDFLDVLPVGTIPSFISGKQYTDFYTASERERAKKLVEKLADARTWYLVERYFEV